MTHKPSRRKHSARKMRSVAPPIEDPGPTKPLDSEDEAGTYAPIHSRDDTGENDDGVIAQGPLIDSPSRNSGAKRRKEALR